MVENVLTLTHAPIVGKIYMVPTIRYTWGDWNTCLSDWPVITPAPHCDSPYDDRDWHIDYRFLSDEQRAMTLAFERMCPDEWPQRPDRQPGERAARQFTCLSLSKRFPYPEPVLRPLECRSKTTAPDPLIGPFDLSAFGNPAEAICTPEGRLLCPHQKMDLTYWPREADGTVICPLHRLRVRVPA